MTTTDREVQKIAPQNTEGLQLFFCELSGGSVALPSHLHRQWQIAAALVTAPSLIIPAAPQSFTPALVAFGEVNCSHVRDTARAEMCFVTCQKGT